MVLLLQLVLTVLSVFAYAKAQSYGELRLVVQRGNGSSPAVQAAAAGGLLEIFLNGEWGTICDSGFDLIDANVACRQMGYKAAVSYATAFHSPFSIGNQNQSVWLSDIDCRDPNGLHLLSCAHGEIGMHKSSTYCDHYFDVAVICDERPLHSTSPGLLGNGSLRLTGGLHRSQGFAEIACGGEWRTVTVCGSDLEEAHGAKGTATFSQKEANAICWQLGFTEASSYKIQEMPSILGDNSSLDDQQNETHTKWYNLIPCTEDYQLCTFTCSNASAEVHACSTNPQDLISNSTYGIWVECNHTITYGSIRLTSHDETNNIESSGGRLEIFLEGQWGTVCAATFGSREANIACQQLGYYRALWYNRSSVVSVKKEKAMPIVLIGVNCTTENDRIGYCSRHPLPEGMTCTHNDDIILACTNDPVVTTGAEVTINSWPLPISKRFLIEISIGAGLGLILCCCCLVVWCTYCCCQCSQRRRRQKRSKQKLSQLLLPDNTQELGITSPDDSETKQAEQDIIVLAAQVQDVLKPSLVPCISPMIPNKNQRSSDAQSASSEGIKPSASNNREEIANTVSASSTSGLRMEPERGMETGLELENEDKRECVGLSMEPIPEERDGEAEEGTGASCEQAMDSAGQQQPHYTGARAGDQIEETEQENTENDGLGMAMDCNVTTAILQSSDATTDHDRLETEI